MYGTNQMILQTTTRYAQSLKEASQEAYALVLEQCQAEHRRQKDEKVHGKPFSPGELQPFLVVDPESYITHGMDLLRSWNDRVRPRIKSQAFMVGGNRRSFILIGSSRVSDADDHTVGAHNNGKVTLGTTNN